MLFNMNSMTLRALLKAIRPLNAVLSALSVLIGYYFSAGLNANSGLYLACLAAALICAAAMETGSNVRKSLTPFSNASKKGLTIPVGWTGRSQTTAQEN